MAEQQATESTGQGGGPAPRVAILANVPVWTLPGLEHLRHHRHYATWLEPLIPAFAEHRDLDLHWVTMCKETAEPIRHEAHHQTFHILPRRKLAVSMMTGYLGETRRISSCLRRIAPDVVHAWGSEDVYGLAGARSGHSNRLFTLQGSLTEYLRLLGGPFLFRLQAAYEKPMVRRYSHGTAETPAARELLRELNPEMDIELVDYGVNPDFFDARWDPSPTPAVLFLGAVTQRKGIVDLIEIARMPQFAGVRFRIAGDGDLRTELEGGAPANVEWLGKCSRDEVIRELSQAWCLAMPTYSDTGPTVIKEARVLGLPIVTTTGAGAACYVEQHDAGFVTAPGDRKALAEALARICSSRDECLAMGRSGWEEQRVQLHPGTTAAAFAGIYRRMASAAGEGGSR